PVPNTDPDFPSVDLDLFPTNVIDSLNIQKVFLPDIPGDFAGGVLDLNTVSFPRKLLVSAGLSTGYNTQTTFRDRLTYRGGGTDWLGFDDGTRALPGVVEGRKLRRSVGGPFPTFDSVNAAGAEFQNRWNLRRTTAMPQMGFNLSVGNSIKLGHQRRFGFLVAAVYDYNVERQVGVSRPRPGATADGDAMELSRYDLESATTSVQMTGIATASLDLGPDHSLTALTMFNRSMDDQTRYRIGINAEVSNTTPYEKWQLRFLGRTVFLNQLLGDHRNLLGSRVRFRWALFHGLGRRDEPDQRTVSYGEGGGIAHRWKPTADRLWSDLGQVDLGGTAQLRFPLWTQAWATLGGRTVFSDRTFSNRRFQMQEAAGGSDPNAFTADPETLFGPGGLGTLSQISESTRAVDSYTSTQKGYAGFLLLETPLFGPVSAAGGARLEVFSQDVASRSPFPEDNTPENMAKNRTARSDTNILPGGALKYAIGEKMLVRAAYGMTLSRPQVRELAPYDYYDFLRDRIIIGNPMLKTATIHNGDVRWEWFFGEGQILAVSGFYKKFIDPIELQIISATTQDSQYLNARGATSLGAELELRSDLARLARALRLFEFNGNLSLIDSRIEVADSGATRTARRLAGQAPYVVNLSLRFLDPDTKLSLGLVYNVVGPRITDVGIRIGDLILPNVEEQAFHSLDFVGGWGLGKHLKVKLKARNLLARSKVLKQGSLVAQELRPGVTVSLGLSYEY
ncbi:MAG: TonB-dependent receptor, partial [Haliangium ochraceum]